MKTSQYKMEITTVMGGTPTSEYLENLISKATGDVVSIIKED
jgi:hypothetical protein